MHVGRRKEDVERSASSTLDDNRSTAIRRERFVSRLGTSVIAALCLGWIWVIATQRSRPASAAEPTAAARVAASLTNSGMPTTAYVTDAAMRALAGELRGASGKLRAELTTAGTTLPDDSAHGGLVVVTEGASEGTTKVPRVGIFRIAAAVNNALKPVADFNLIGTRPHSEKREGRLGTYLIGSWPGEGGGRVSAPKKAPADRYRPPSGFIEVTPANADTKVSDHFTLRDFLTKGQANVWPKYLVLELRTVDKLELVLSDLASRGVNTKGVRVMSGFRTPSYNKGGGNTAGRAGLSRHMYGDAADVYIDNDGNGNMDDLNRDGKINIGDARFIQEAVDRVEAAHPELIGGTGVYPAASGHGPFIHIDTRGYRARWNGTGGGGS